MPQTGIMLRRFIPIFVSSILGLTQNPGINLFVEDEFLGASLENYDKGREGEVWNPAD